MLASKGVIIAGEAVNRDCEGQDFQYNLFLWLNFYSRNNVPKIKNGEYVINLNEYESLGTSWIALYVNGDNVTYFDSFGV